MYRIICKYQDSSSGLVSNAISNNVISASNSCHSSTIRHKSGGVGVDNEQEVTIPLVATKPVITNTNFLAVYFDRRHKDLKLLLNLLAETSGLPESFRILTLFDKKFQSLWKPQNLRFEEYETVLPNRTVTSRSIIVRWNDAPISHFLANYNATLAFEYTIDISPSPANDLGLKSVLYKKDSVESSIIDVESRKAAELQTSAMSGKAEKNYRYEVAFDNITAQEDEYTVTISTELNGRTVTQMVEKFPMGGQPMENPTTA